MTGRSCILENFYPNDWGATVLQKHSPLRPAPSFPFPLDLPPADCIKSQKRQALDHHSARISASGLTGSDIAVEYLLDKYRHNLAMTTIKQASGVVLSFLHFINESGANLFRLTHKDLCAFVEHVLNCSLYELFYANYLSNVSTLDIYLDNLETPADCRVSVSFI